MLTLQAYEETGEMKSFENGLQAYVCMNKKTPVRTALIVGHDIFGVNSGRHKAICDELAKEIPGLVVIMPDIFDGDELISAPGLGMGCWFAFRFLCAFLCCCNCKYMEKYLWEVKQEEIYVKTIIPYLRKLGAKKIGAMGFCFGTYMVLKLSGTGEIDCGISFHPSLDGSKGICTYSSEPKTGVELCSEVKCPQLVVHTVGDAESWLPDGEAHNAADKVIKGNRWLKTEQKHGFMSRGDPADKETKAAIKKYFQITKEFLLMWFKVN